MLARRLALALFASSLLVACSGSDGGSEGTPPPGEDAAIDDAAIDEDALSGDDTGTSGDDTGSTEDGTSGEDSASSEDSSIADTGKTADTSTTDTSTTTPKDTGAATDTSTTPKDTGAATDTGSATDTGPTVTPGACWLTLSGATGKEADGKIPVCCEPTSTEKTAIMQVFAMVNDHRKANGRAPLVYDEKLEAPIQGHCEHMRTHSFFSHNAPEGVVSSFTTRANRCGTTAGGENIAWGYTTAAQVMDGWKKSPGHNSNMLNSSWKRMAVGKSGTYWGQLFAP